MKLNFISKKEFDTIRAANRLAARKAHQEEIRKFEAFINSPERVKWEDEELALIDRFDIPF